MASYNSLSSSTAFHHLGPPQQGDFASSLLCQEIGADQLADGGCEIVVPCPSGRPLSTAARLFHLCCWSGVVCAFHHGHCLALHFVFSLCYAATHIQP